ncbi:MAG: Gfo/Idh/MocA family oxidoreductase [Clostridia bacterium]|jgi:predicted dehydrogenase|nr:Gfo/Idh/MocA family oxidoreductase [Clostridia bacterium]
MSITGSKTDGVAVKLKYGMVGGGPGSFIGDVHRRAIALDGKVDLVAGSFSDVPDEVYETGHELGLGDERLYVTYQEMAEKEAAREDGIDFVVIVTPNFLHYPVAKAFLEVGIHVVCEKPLCFEVAQGEELKKIADAKGCLFGVTYTYTGHVMAKQARDMIAKGEIGEVRVVMAEYPQDWLIESDEELGMQGAWRTNPKLSGRSNCLGDIGSHAENMVNYMTGLKLKKLCAKMDTKVAGRTLDDNSQVLLEYENGATGTLWCSQIAIGNDNALRVRIFGKLGSIDFVQEDSNYMKVTKKGEPTQIYSRGTGAVGEVAGAFSRLPAGHPEGFFAAYANIYSAFAAAVYDKAAGKDVDEESYGYPTIDMGIDGVRFVNKCCDSNDAGSVWVDF